MRSRARLAAVVVAAATIALASLPAHAQEPPAEESVRLAVRNPTGDLTLTLHNATRYADPWPGAIFEPVCTAPCEASLAPGAYHFAVASGTEPPVSLEELVRFDETATLELHYESHSATRTAGWWTYAAGLGATLAGIVYLGLTVESDDGIQSGDVRNAVIGGGLSLVGLAVMTIGLVLAFTPDTAAVEVIRAAP
jgi:hypothetical protein